MHGRTGMPESCGGCYLGVLDDANAIFSSTEIEGVQEEHHQLPPDENVPQGCWTSQEEWCPGLKHLIIEYD